MCACVPAQLNLLFTVLFVLEMMLKIFGRGWQGYISDRWNKFDFFVVIASLLDLALAPTSFELGQALAKIFRIFRVMRVLRLVKNTRGLRRLLLTLWSTLPSLANVGSLLLLLFFIFAVLGMQMCGNTARVRACSLSPRVFGWLLPPLIRPPSSPSRNGACYTSSRSG